MKKCSLLSMFIIFLFFNITLYAEEIRPPHVFSKVEFFSNELELIRLQMGSHKLQRKLPLVSGVTPHEVYFQAMTMCHKARQIRFEWTRNMGNCPELKVSNLRPADVYIQVEESLKHLLKLKEYFGIKDSVQDTLINNTKTPTDVFLAIMYNNQQLNALMKKRFSPDDVFRNVTRAIYYGAELLKKFPQVQQRIPQTPPYQTQKTPKDVYLRLAEGVSLITKVRKTSNLESLDFSVNKDSLNNIVPSDVYDITNLLVSELAYLYWKTGGTEVIESYQPSPKVPSDVYQRSGILIKQLQILLKHIKQQPQWLDKS